MISRDCGEPHFRQLEPAGAVAQRRELAPGRRLMRPTGYLRALAWSPAVAGVHTKRAAGLQSGCPLDVDRLSVSRSSRVSSDSRSFVAMRSGAVDSDLRSSVRRVRDRVP